MSDFRTVMMTIAMTTFGAGYCLSAEPTKEVTDIPFDQKSTQNNPGEQPPRKPRTELSDLMRRLEKGGKVYPNEVTSDEILVWKGTHINPADLDDDTACTNGCNLF